MNWKKRKKRNKIMKHYGFYTYVQYEMLLRIKYYVQHYKEKNWFSEEDRIMIAIHIVHTTYQDKRLKKNKNKGDKTNEKA